MGTAYAIDDTETANLIDTFQTEGEALALVKRAVDEDGPESVEGPSAVPVREWEARADSPFPSRVRRPWNRESPCLRPSHGEEPSLHVEVPFRVTSNRRQT